MSVWKTLTSAHQMDTLKRNEGFYEGIWTDENWVYTDNQSTRLFGFFKNDPINYSSWRKLREAKMPTKNISEGISLWP